MCSLKYFEINRKLILAFVALCYFLNSGCIHTTSYEVKSIESPSNNGLSNETFDSTEIHSTVYLPTKLPLNDFFGRLRRGDFTKAFKDIDLNYSSSNINDKALEEIIDNGYIPAYVEIINQGEKPITFDEKNFILKHEKNEIKAFYSESLPREFKKFNPSSVAANIVNTGIIIVGFAAVLVVMIAIQNNSAGGSPTFPNNLQNNEQSSTHLYNDTIQTTRIDYKHYLLTATTLKHGESKKGLLFFNTGNLIGIHNFKLSFVPNTTHDN